MRPSRRTLLGVLAAGAATAAGCLAGRPASSNGTTDQPSDSTTDSDSTTTTDRTTTGPSRWTPPTDEIDYDHEVQVENADDEGHTVVLRISDVTDGTSAVVHEARYDVPAAGDRATETTAFTFSSLDETDRIRRFEVGARLEGDGGWSTETIAMNACFGEVIVAIDEDGRLDLIYSIC